MGFEDQGEYGLSYRGATSPAISRPREMTIMPDGFLLGDGVPFPIFSPMGGAPADGPPPRRALPGPSASAPPRPVKPPDPVDAPAPPDPTPA